jgi:L-amino acid N-acyltransferase YncA
MTSTAENRPTPSATTDPSFGLDAVQGPRKDAIGTSGYRFSRATRDDIPAIVALQEPNLRSNGGSLSVRFSPAWFEPVIADMPVIVARSGGDVVGYVVSTQLTAQAHNPIIRAMLRSYPGSPGAYNYGPICVAQNHRNRGLATAMVAQLRTQLPGREGLTFIRRDNAASLAFHGKIGMHQVAEFALGDVTYVVVAYVG